MKRFCIVTLLGLLPFVNLRAQTPPPADPREGIYQTAGLPDLELHISKKKEGLSLQIMMQGVFKMTQLSADRFQLAGVKPKAIIEFQRDSTGTVTGCIAYQQEPPRKWKKQDDSTWQLVLNPYRIFHLTHKAGGLFCHIAGQPDVPLEATGSDRYQYTRNGGRYSIRFERDDKGNLAEMTSEGNSIAPFVKTSSILPHRSSRTNGFTHDDTLHGALTPLRTCYDVLFYHLDLTVQPETHSIHGSNLIRWRTVQPFRRMQVDLFANLAIDSIIYHGGRLSYTREENAVYIDLPAETAAGSTDQLRVFYGGSPLSPDIDANQGGIFWLWNRDRNFWIQSVTQGIGARVFWPCKDHLSDRPDSMRITVTVPHGLSDISNGRLLSKTELPGSQTRFDWYVDYPIVTYNVVLNIGDYVSFDDSYVRGGDTLALHYYCLPYDLDSARALFSDSKRMIALYERDFGPYPFPRDGFSIMESIYPMDHQGAVSIGMFRNPFNSDKYDGDLRHMMWHESAHEWWGNNVGCSDYADMWIHEGFATFAEFLNQDAVAGRASAIKEILYGHPDNREPIIGVYDVNHFHMGDMYLKGALLLQTLRNAIGNDSLFFAAFHDIQQRFRYTPVRSTAVEGRFNAVTGKDWGYFFDQYLRHAAPPTLALGLQPTADGLRMTYKWAADVPDFRLPVKITLAKDSLGFIYPTTREQTLELKGLRREDFAVDTTDFYVTVRYEQQP